MIALPRRSRAPRGEDGFVVFGCLILIVVVFVSAVLLGKLIHGEPPLHLQAGTREVRHVVRPVELTYGARIVDRLERGDSVWVERVEGGEVVVYASPDALEMVGFAPDSLLPRARPAR